MLIFYESMRPMDQNRCPLRKTQRPREPPIARFPGAAFATHCAIPGGDFGWSQVALAARPPERPYTLARARIRSQRIRAPPERKDARFRLLPLGSHASLECRPKHNMTESSNGEGSDTVPQSL
jgi:hypothetical protein